MFHPVDSHPNFPKLEEEILKFWEKETIFEKSLEKSKNGKPYTFYDGPPFATGLPHYGHILASTIKDVIPRYQTMKGRFVRRRWGWDCHGLPIEEIVERQLKISGKKDIEEKIGIKKFNEICRQQVLTYVKEWGKMVRRVARWVDFDNSYKTMDRPYMESVWWAFKQIYDKGLVYEGRKVLLYCPRCETPVSNFEVAMDNSYRDVTEEAVIVKFKVKNNAPQPPLNIRGGEGELYFLAWTTTPWTLPGNVALAVGKDIDYVMVEKDGENYIVAKNRLESVFARSKATKQSQGQGIAAPLDKLGARNDIIIIKELKGSDLVGLEYEPLFEVPAFKQPINGRATGSVPIYRQKVYKVYPADFVTTEEGAGIVHTAVVYGEEDYELGIREGLPVVPLLDEKGHFNEKSPDLIRGKYFKGAEKIIKEDLESRGLLFKKEMYTHSYPHCWRCGTALFYNAIPAWFVNVQKIKKKLLTSNEKEISWYPEHLKFGRYAKSMESAPDWNISRNRFWGNPIPVWRCKDCGKDTVVGSIEEIEKFQITSAKSQTNSKSKIPNSKLDLHRPHIDEVILKCEHCGGNAKRITEIFDSWFEAASMPFASVHYPFEKNSPRPSLEKRGVPSLLQREGKGEFVFPAQFVAEYIAQTRAWFYVMHVMSLVLFGKTPFENVVTTGTILAEDGSKMSKSKNNYPDPWLMIDKYGSDTLRFYLMNSVVMQAENLNFSEKDLANAHRKVILIFWNVYNYFVTYAPPHLTSPTSGEELKEGGENILDQWIVARSQELINEATKFLDKYDTVRATREIENFISDLSTWYLRRSRGRQDAAFFETLRKALITLAQIVAPFMPYISEHIYRNLTPPLSPPHEGGRGGGVSVHLSDWPKSKKLTKEQEKLLVSMSEIRKIVEEVHALRAKAGIKLRQPLGQLQILDFRFQNKELLEILKEEVNVLVIEFGDKLELDTKITPDLKISGLARELERQIQQFRKESGLKIGEIVDLYYETKSANIKRALENMDRKKTYIQSIEYGISNIVQNTKYGIQYTKTMEVGGERVKFLISNAK
ncbi:MAG: isoleucine--tRNA ligase [bacterium]|nr:isoleucine--tRNA ligase [bacterium]